MGSMIMQIVDILAWMAMPLAIICVADDWFLRSKRLANAKAGQEVDPGYIKLAYLLFPITVIACLVKLFVGTRTDFGLVLVSVTAVSGLVWLIDTLLLRRRRESLFAARPAGLAPAEPWPPEPATLDYARSFFPVAAVLLILRSFIFEPYRIPSDSMMPTLLDGDFIVVNKYAYGMRLPVTHQKVVAIGAPQRGDVVVFRYPLDLGINYIKRVVGLPGDRVEIRSDQLIINGEPVALTEIERYGDGCYINMQLAEEKLGEHTHQVLHCLSPSRHEVGGGLPNCNRDMRENYLCQPGLNPGDRDTGDASERVVPEGQYLMIGDNRDNSEDGRYWGFVKEEYLVGRATRIWFNFDLDRKGQRFQWQRVGKKID
jgi:signal peptidase I